MRASKAMICAILIASAGISLLRRSEAAAPHESSTPSPAAPADQDEVRTQIRSLESLLPQVPDRGATLFLLARRYAHLGDSEKALTLLKQCLALEAGFVPDPDQAPSLRPLQSQGEFRQLLQEARRHYSAVHQAHVAFTVPEEDLFPEGLAVDASNGLFYMGSMHRKKIVKFTLPGGVFDFVKEDVYDLSPVGGVHVDPLDHSVWASTDAGVKERPELVHFDAQGKLLERYPSPGKMPYDLNDLVLRGGREIFTTDTEGHHVYRFDRMSHRFTEMKLWRPVFYPNGISLSRDCHILFVADMLGVIRVDLETNDSADVIPAARDTLSGIDGLYWHNGELLGIQYGTGEYRVMRWKLSPDGRKVTSREVLEYRTDLTRNPTTGAIRGGDFYFIANTGIDNLQDDRIVDRTKLEPVHIAVVTIQ